MQNCLMVGVRGFEPPTSWSQTRRATRLRYTPTTSSNTPPFPQGQGALTKKCAVNYKIGGLILQGDKNERSL
jgi:hypothetical protein